MLEAEVVPAATPNQERHIAKCSKDKVEAGVGNAENADRINFIFKQIKRKASSNELNSVTNKDTVQR